MATNPEQDASTLPTEPELKSTPEDDSGKNGIATLQQESTKKRYFLPKEMISLQAKPNSDYITDAAMVELTKFTKMLLLHPQAKILIEGYIASNNDTPENTRLSERRANLVKEYMVGKGVDPAQIQVIGKGNSNPIASNDTPTGRRINRRIEIRVISDPYPRADGDK